MKVEGNGNALRRRISANQANSTDNRAKRFLGGCAKKCAWKINHAEQEKSERESQPSESCHVAPPKRRSLLHESGAGLIVAQVSVRK